MFFQALWLAIQSVNIQCYSLIHIQFLWTNDAKLIFFFKVNFQITDLSKDGLPWEKCLYPIACLKRQSNNYDEGVWLSMWRIPRLVGWPVLRSFVIPPMHPKLFRPKTIEKLVLATRNWNSNRVFATRMSGVKFDATSEYLHVQLSQREWLIKSVLNLILALIAFERIKKCLMSLCCDDMLFFIVSRHYIPPSTM